MQHTDTHKHTKWNIIQPQKEGNPSYSFNGILLINKYE